MVWTVIGIVLGLIGAVSSIWFLFEKLSKRYRISWRFAEKSVKKIMNKMMADNFSPTLIVGIGRGGAIMGSLISGALGHRPLIVIDRKYEWENGRRKDGIYESIAINLGLEKVLLIAGEVHTGNTMRLYYDYFKDLGAKQIKKATLFYEIGSTENIDYKGYESDRKNIRMPWMFTNNYRCQSRSEEQAKGLK